MTENGPASIALRASRWSRCSAGWSTASPSRSRCRDVSSCLPSSRNTRGGAAPASVANVSSNAIMAVIQLRCIFLRIGNVVHHNAVEPRISIITLGVADLERSLQFYRHGLGLPTTWSPEKGVIFFQTTGVALALYPLHELAKD